MSTLIKKILQERLDLNEAGKSKKPEDSFRLDKGSIDEAKSSDYDAKKKKINELNRALKDADGTDYVHLSSYAVRLHHDAAKSAIQAGLHKEALSHIDAASKHYNDII